MTSIKSKISISIILVVFLTISLLNSCKKYPDPSVEKLINYSFSKMGSDQRAFAGSYLKDSIITSINGVPSSASGFEVYYDVIKGVVTSMRNLY